MRRPKHAIALALLTAALSSVSVLAAEALPPSDPSKPVTAARVGGSPADREFRTAVQQSGDRYRQARAECNKRPAAERSACVGAAREALKQARSEAKARHAAAQKKKR